MNKIIKKIEEKYPFITSLIISFGIIMWFRGIIGVIDIIFIKKHNIVNYILLMIFSLIILYTTNVGVNVIFDIEQRRKINNILEKDTDILEEDKQLLMNQINNDHKYSTLYPTMHALI